ncbi:hypothetical protein B0J14DRAFT_351131 [Halenospora varia]|nr:hypothetical protein B0J14DRAFT_351131 [Halenospora varia]
MLTQAPGIFWVTNGGGHTFDPRFRLIDGLSRTARTKNNKLNFVTLALEHISASIQAATKKVWRIFENAMANEDFDDSESEYIEEMVVWRLVV